MSAAALAAAVGVGIEADAVRARENGFGVERGGAAHGPAEAEGDRDAGSHRAGFEKHGGAVLFRAFSGTGAVFEEVSGIALTIKELPGLRAIPMTAILMNR